MKTLTNTLSLAMVKMTFAAQRLAEKVKLLFISAITYLFAPTPEQRKRCYGASHTIEILVAIIIVVVIGAAVLTLFKDTIVDIWNNNVKPKIVGLFS